MNRRDFLKTAAGTAAATAAAGLLVSCGTSSEGSQPTSSAGGGGTSKVTLGFIALTDAASLIMAKELGYFAEHGVDVTLAKQASWPALRDALLNRQIDGAHCLYSMPLSVATGIGGNSSRDLQIAMMLNQNGQGITLSNDLKAAGYADLSAAKAAIEANGDTSLGMTFPGGTHDLWLRYWLAATGADTSKVKIDPIPPPQMVQNMTVGNVDGYCVGEPWNAVAVQQDIGFTHLATQDLWQNHPEKALVVHRQYATDKTDDLKAVMAAVLEASRWLDEPDNRATAADTIGAEAYVNAPAAEIRSRLTGVYELGADLGTKEFGGRQMQFFRNGEVNPPRTSHALWALAQYRRLGMVSSDPAYQEIAEAVLLRDLYTEVATEAGVAVPDDDMAPFTVQLDNTTFDPTQPEKEASRT